MILTRISHWEAENRATLPRMRRVAPSRNVQVTGAENA